MCLTEITYSNKCNFTPIDGLKERKRIENRDNRFDKTQVQIIEMKIKKFNGQE
jgi:hypothetical protein